MNGTWARRVPPLVNGGAVTVTKGTGTKVCPEGEPVGINVSTSKLVTTTTEVEVLVTILVIASSVPVSAGFVLGCPRSLSGVLSMTIRGLNGMNGWN